MPEGRVELPWVAPADFESAAYAISPLRQDAARTIVAQSAAVCETIGSGLPTDLKRVTEFAWPIDTRCAFQHALGSWNAPHGTALDDHRNAARARLQPV